MLLLFIHSASVSDIAGFFNLMTNEGIMTATIRFSVQEKSPFDCGNCNLLFHTVPKRCGISQFRVVLTLADENWKSSQALIVPSTVAKSAEIFIAGC